MDHFFESYETGGNLEKLEDGVFREHFSFAKDVPESGEPTDLFGTPEKDAEVWSKAGEFFSDSVMCEKFAAESLSGECVPEEAILSEMENRGVYDRDFGCVRGDVGAFSELSGLEVYRETGLSVKDLCESLDNNEKVVCAVSSVSLLYPEIGDMPGLSADSYIEVIGIDASETGRETVLVNNPNGAEGGEIFPLSDFCSAWEKSGRFAAVISKSEESTK